MALMLWLGDNDAVVGWCGYWPMLTAMVQRLEGIVATVERHWRDS